jgi:drug/metabolite transporter (DMT)-like permease
MAPSSKAPLSLESRGLILMCVASALFAVMTLAARSAAASANWAAIGASRAFMGAVVALVFALQTGASLKTRSPGLSWARSIFGTISAMATFYALSRVDLALGDAVTLLSTSPLFIAILAPWLLREPTNRRVWAVLVVAFAGVALIAGPHLSLRALPAIAAVVAAVTSAIAMMFLRLMRSGQNGEPESTAAIAFHFAVLAFAVQLVANFFVWQMPTPRDWALLILAGTAGGLAQLAMTRAYALAQAARLGAMSYLGTVLSFIGSVAILGEEPRALQLVGSVMVVGAGVLLALTTRERPLTK